MNFDSIAYFSGIEIDKIVDVKAGTFVNVSDTILRQPDPIFFSGLNVFSIPHGFSRPVFTDALIRTPDLGGTPWLSPGNNTLNFITYSTSTHVCIAMVSNLNINIQYRVICSWITDYDTTNPLVPEFHPVDKSILFDSRVNYQKIASSGIVTGGNNFNPPHSINNPTNKLSNFKVFLEAFAGEVWVMNAGGQQNPFAIDFSQMEGEAVITSQSLEISTSNGLPSQRSWYKIYYDG